MKKLLHLHQVRNHFFFRMTIDFTVYLEQKFLKLKKQRRKKTHLPFCRCITQRFPDAEVLTSLHVSIELMKELMGLYTDVVTKGQARLD